MSERITLAHGSGGKLTHRLIEGLFHRYFRNELLLEAGDSAIFNVHDGRMAFTTDSYVISPIFFKGGNIGKLAVCGTVNDLAVSGAVPKLLSAGFIIEEGFPIKDLEAIVQSMADAAKEAGVSIVTGDTKVVQRGCADGIFINTTGLGMVREGIQLGLDRVRPGDRILVTGYLGDHGTAIFLEREQFGVQSSIASDCAPLNGLIGEILEGFGSAVRIMRDPTRGGLATTLNELAKGQSYGIRLDERLLPVRDEVRGVCEMLGMDPLYMANEGKAVLIVEGEQAEEVAACLRGLPYGGDSAIIGEVTEAYAGKVHMKTITGGSRIVDMLTGDQLPRIC